MSLKDYQNIILDFDGVIIDSNRLKADNIQKVVSRFCESEDLKEFIHYFIHNNGVPREFKINKFFKDLKTAQTILSEYNALNARTLKHALLTDGFADFLQEISSYPSKRYVLSGGEQEEVVDVLKFKGIADQFQGIFGGPRTKKEHLDKLQLSGRTLLIGDSQTDCDVSEMFHFDFIFMYGYSQIDDWKSFLKGKSYIGIIRNFTELNKAIHDKRRETDVKSRH